MTPSQYQDRVAAELDAMRTSEKNDIITGLLAVLYPQGHGDHRPGAIAFLDEARRLLAAFHPARLRVAVEPVWEEDQSVPEF